MTTSFAVILCLLAIVGGWLAHRGARKRRKVLESLDRAVRRNEVEGLNYAFSDDTPVSSVYQIEGLADGIPFVLEAKESRSGKMPFSRFFLYVTPDVSGIRGGFGFGGDYRESRLDQHTLYQLFVRLWPVGNYPRPAMPLA